MGGYSGGRLSVALIRLAGRAPLHALRPPEILGSRKPEIVSDRDQSRGRSRMARGG